jgi:hypothetical protein
MTHTNLNRRIDATEIGGATPRSANMRACLHSAVATMQSCFKAFVIDRRRSGDRGSAQGTGFSNRRRDQRALGHSASIGPVARLAKIIIAALTVIAGVVALDFLVLWIAADRLIERMPF